VWLGACSTLAAQQPVSVSGRVLHGGRDTVPLPTAMVVLHHISRMSSGPVDSTRSDSRGRYRFELRNVDSTGPYIVSVWYDSLAYVSAPLGIGGRPSRVAHVDDIVVFETTTDGPPIALARRLMTIARARDAGTREVLEILELENRGQTTRVTDDTVRPTWAGRVPEHTGQFRGGEGDISPEAMRFRHDSVLVFAPIGPGHAKQLNFAYTLAAGVRTLVIPIDQPTAVVNLLVEDTTAVVRSPKLESLGVQAVEQRTFAAYRAGPLAPGERIDIQLPAGEFRAQRLLPYVIGVLAVGMVVALFWALRRRPPAPRLT
jgi:hypothetical protein